MASVREAGEVPNNQPMKFSRWFGTAASIVGTGHVAGGIPCQDSSAVVIESEFQLAVVSDGAGSARLSHFGSAAVVEALVDLGPSVAIPRSDAEGVEVAERIAKHCLARLDQTAEDLGCEVQDLAATLSFVLVRGESVLAGCVGDGIVAATGPSGSEVLVGPARGEHANQTEFITSNGAARRLRLRWGPLGRRDGFMVMSDGAADSLFERSSARLASAVGRVLSWFDENSQSAVVEAIEASVLPLLTSKTRDDCSIACLRRVSLDEAQLERSGSEFQMAFLGAGNAKGVRTRLAVLRESQAQATATVGDIAMRLKVSQSTVRRHLREVRRLLPTKAAENV